MVLVMVLLSAFALAGKSEIKIEPIKNSITTTDTASFKLTISNNEDVTQRYSVFSFVQGWNIEPSPLKDKIMEIQPNQKYQTMIKASPTEKFSPGIYKLGLNIETDLGEKHLTTLVAYIDPEKPLDYLPSIKVDLDMTKKIDPQKAQTIKLSLENKNPLNISKMTIKLQSDITEFNKQTTIGLEPLSTKTVEFAVLPNSMQKPGKHFLFFTFERNKEVIKVISQEMEIISLSPKFKTTINQTRSFLKTTNNIVVKNLGNVKNTQDVVQPISFWKNLFTKSQAKMVIKNGQKNLVWKVTLAPNETVTLTYIHNYRFPFYGVMVLLLLVFVYLFTKAPVTLVKTSTTARKDSTLSDLKITLQLKNVTKRTLKKIEVVDLVPGIADIEKSLELGTLKPHEIKHTKKGTLVKWKLAEIDSHEDRLITYQIRSKLKILGTLKLPRARVLYGKKGKRKTAYSNVFKISGQS